MKNIFLLFLFLGTFNTASAEWNSYLGAGKTSNAKEGFAFSGWTILLPSLNWPNDRIRAALVASCNDKGEKSVYVRMLATYPAFETDLRVDTVEGKIGWDSSKPYDAPFTYDAGLNALRLQSGLEDSLSMIRNGNNVTFQIPWRNSHQAVFEFSLNGSSQALSRAFSYCADSI